MATWTLPSENVASWSSPSEPSDASANANAGQAMGVLGLTYSGGQVLSGLPTQWSYQTEN